MSFDGLNWGEYILYRVSMPRRACRRSRITLACVPVSFRLLLIDVTHTHLSPPTRTIVTSHSIICIATSTGSLLETTEVHHSMATDAPRFGLELKVRELSNISSRTKSRASRTVCF
jgi:hypothetical protein